MQDGSEPRQEIRLTSTSFVVLGLIDYAGPSTPYDLKRMLERSVEQFWPVPHTTFYAEPERLARAGYLTAEQEEGGRRRKTYSITDRGRGALRDWIATADPAPPQLHDEGMLLIFFGADPGPILRQRVRWHEAKLAELDGFLAGIRMTGGPPGVLRSLIGGAALHRTMIQMTKRLVTMSGGRNDEGDKHGDADRARDR